MAETIVYPDVPALVLGVLADRLAVPVGNRVPSPRPPRFVVARRAGGERTSVVTEDALIMVECWGPGPAEAADLAQDCRAHLHALAGTVVDGIPIYRVVDVGGPGDLPDPLSDQPRHTFTVAVTVRGTPEEEG